MMPESKPVFATLAGLLMCAFSFEPAQAFCFGNIEVVSRQRVQDSSCPSPALSKTLEYKCIDACGHESAPASRTIVGFGECFRGSICQASAAITCLPLEGQEINSFNPPSVSFSVVHREGYYELPPCLLPACRNNGVVSATVSCPCQESNGDFDLVDCANDPLVVSLGDAKYSFTSLADGVVFDLNADGTAEQVPWTLSSGDDAFLVLDRNRNGVIDDGSELFGDATPQHRTTEPNGFLALAVYDDELNGGTEDGLIDTDDAVFDRLRLWLDIDHDGVSTPGELHLLEDVGLVAIDLSYREASRTDRHGNEFRYWAASFWSSGTQAPVWNVFLSAE